MLASLTTNFTIQTLGVFDDYFPILCMCTKAEKIYINLTPDNLKLHSCALFRCSDQPCFYFKPLTLITNLADYRNLVPNNQHKYNIDYLGIYYNCTNVSEGYASVIAKF